jgi:hypothetical protein
MHFGPIAPGTRRIQAWPDWCDDELFLGSPRQGQCGNCGLITYTLKAQRARRTLDGRCLDPRTDYSVTGLPLMRPCYLASDGRTVWSCCGAGNGTRLSPDTGACLRAPLAALGNSRQDCCMGDPEPLLVTCPACKHKFAFATAGYRTIRCPRCNRAFRVRLPEPELSGRVRRRDIRR